MNDNNNLEHENSNNMDELLDFLTDTMKLFSRIQKAKNMADILIKSFNMIGISCQFVTVFEKRAFLIFPDGIYDKTLYHKLRDIFTWDNGVSFDLLDSDTVLIPIGDILFENVDRLMDNK